MTVGVFVCISTDVWALCEISGDSSCTWFGPAGGSLTSGKDVGVDLVDPLVDDASESIEMKRKENKRIEKELHLQ